MTHWRVSCASASTPPSMVLHSRPEDVPSLELRGSNWWHVALGVTLPLLAELDQHGLCACPGASCTCECVHLVTARVSQALLGRQLAILPHAELVDSGGPMPAATAFLRRCDELLDRGRNDARRRGAASYFDACTSERPWASVRSIVGGLAGVNLSRATRPARLLVVTREGCDDLKLAKHVHRAICLRLHDSLALSQLGRPVLEGSVVTFEELSFADQVRAVAGATAIVFAHGAALANMWFARPGTLLIELTPYLRDEVTEGPQQLDAGRDAGQRIARTLTANGVPVSHVAVPTAPLGIDGCDSRSCLDRALLRSLLLAHARPVSSVPIEVGLDHRQPSAEAQLLAALLVLAAIAAEREPPPDWTTAGPCHALSSDVNTTGEAHTASNEETQEALVADSACPATGRRPIGQWDVPVLLRVQKTGSTTMRRLWEHHRRPRSAEEDLSIGCHLTFAQLHALVPPPSRPWIVVLVREPVARVWSEYRHCVSTSACAEQRQWDYLRVAPKLAQRFAWHRRGRRPLEFRDFVEWRPNPAHNRQAEYLSGRRYSRNGPLQLRHAFMHLCRAAAVVPLTRDAATALRSVASQLGWRLSAQDFWVHEPGGGAKASWQRADAAQGPFVDHTAAQPDDSTRMRVLELNRVDQRLFERAMEIFSGQEQEQLE